MASDNPKLKNSAQSTHKHNKRAEWSDCFIHSSTFVVIFYLEQHKPLVQTMSANWERDWELKNGNRPVESALMMAREFRSYGASPKESLARMELA